MPEQRTLVANLIPQINDEDMKRWIEQLNKDFTTALTVDAQINNGQSPTNGIRTASDEKNAQDTKKAIEEINRNTKDIPNNGKNRLDWMSQIKSGLSDAKESIGEKMAGIGGMISKIGVPILGAILMISDIAVGVFKRLVQASPFLRNILEMFNMALNLILGPIGTAIGIELIPIITRMYERIMKGVQAMWDAYEEGGLAGMLKEAFYTLWDVFAPLIPELIDVGLYIVNELCRAIGGLINDWIKNSLMSWWNDITSGEKTFSWESQLDYLKRKGSNPYSALFPTFASGGIIEPTQYGTLVNVGEGGEREYIVPESKKYAFSSSVMSNVGGTVYNYVTVNGYTDEDLTDKIISVLDKRTDASRLMGGL